MTSVVALGLVLGAPASAAAAEDRAALMAQHQGGVLKLTASAAAGTIDPQINYEGKYWSLFFIAYDGLVSFKKVDGPASNEVVADLAESIPTPTDGGKTYVFTLRNGIKFSDGRDVTVDDVVASFRRIFKVSSPNAGSWYANIVGADACLRVPATCTLDGGVVADPAANAVTIHLTAPDSEFLYKLATPFASVLPADTPPHDLGTTPAPTTGPYMFASYDPNRLLRMVRNPYFKEWSELAQPAGYPDEIDYSFGLPDESEVTAVENGQQDWMADAKPLDRLAELSTKYAKQVHIHPLLAYYYVPMNTRIPPFDNIKARQAVAYAIDRAAAVKLYGGANLATPTCQNLPAGMPGYEPYCPFTKNPGTKWTAPDLARAKQLVEESGTAGQKVTLITSDTQVDRSIGVYLQSVLREIGYDASVKAISSNIQFTYIQNSNNTVQISLTDWFQDYPAASDFLNVLFSCDSFHEGSDSSINMSGYCNRKVDAEMQKALATAVTDPASANKMWATIDREITDDAPVAALFQMKYLEIVSSRVGNYTYSDQFHMIFSQAWVQ